MLLFPYLKEGQILESVYVIIWNFKFGTDIFIVYFLYEVWEILHWRPGRWFSGPSERDTRRSRPRNPLISTRGSADSYWLTAILCPASSFTRGSFFPLDSTGRIPSQVELMTSLNCLSGGSTPGVALTPHHELLSSNLLAFIIKVMKPSMW